MSGGADRRLEQQRAASRMGRRAETLAALALMLKGWRILERNHGGKGGEIDLIAKRGRTIAFVEVKARATLGEAEIAITPAKQAFIARRVALWRAQNPWSARFTLRFDAVFVTPRSWPRHRDNLFELPPF
jgi:putative endonuclease